MKNRKMRGLAFALALGAFSVCSQSYSASGNPTVNQVGYLPNSAKVAVLKSNASEGVNWELRKNGAVVSSGVSTPFGLDASSGDRIHHIDFSSVNTEGTGFTLHAAGNESYPFKISSSAFTPILYDSIKYFYHNRSGIEIETQHTGGGNGSYVSNSQWARPAGHLNQGRNQGDFAVPCWTGTRCNYTLDVTKGWYDAGDHGKYVVNGGISAWKLLNMYERAKHISNSASKFGDGTLNIPESGNGIADILDEVRWQIEFLIAMQVPKGEVKAGMAHHKMHDVGWTGLPLAPHEDGQARALVPPSVTATLNLAAVGAQCARLFATIDSTFANTCLNAAERAWKAAMANPNDIYTGGFDNGGGGYGDEDPADEFFWAASELFLTTASTQYLSTINNRIIEKTDWAWPDTDIPGLMSLAIVPSLHSSDQRATARAKLIEIADHHLETVNSTGYMPPSAPDEYYWGSNNVVANKMAILGLAYDFTGNDAYAKAFSKALNYLFGNNTLSFSYISGHGENSLKQPHHRFWAGALNNRYPWVPPGAFSGGPNSGLEDSTAQNQLNGCQSTPAKCFIDDINSWSTNEITINWNSALAWILAFYDDYGKSSGLPTPSPSPVPTASITPSPTTPTPTVTPTTIATPSPTPSLEKGIACDVRNINNWGNGYQIDIEVINNGTSAVNTWEVYIDFGEAPLVTGSWNADVISSGNIVTANNLNWNGNLAPGASTSFGFQGNTDGSLNTPTCNGALNSPTNSPTPTPDITPTATPPVTATPTPTASPTPEAPSENCKFEIIDSWETGFTGQITLTNNSTSNINSWNVSWTFSDSTRITSSWNANLVGSNPYTASNLDWNGSLSPGQSISFGFQGTAEGSVKPPKVNGRICE